jgi:SAM-dependent methyltransferase
VVDGWHASLKLEIGPGFVKRVRRKSQYRFKPKISGEDVIYVDVGKPTFFIQNFVRADAHFLPFKHESFDEIYSSHLVGYLRDPKVFLKSCFCMLKKKGKLHLWAPNFLMKHPSLRHVFNFISLRKLMHDTGFKTAYFHVNIGSALPKPLRYAVKNLSLILCNELYLTSIK